MATKKQRADRAARRAAHAARIDKRPEGAPRPSDERKRLRAERRAARNQQRQEAGD